MSEIFYDASERLSSCRGVPRGFFVTSARAASVTNLGLGTSDVTGSWYPRPVLGVGRWQKSRALRASAWYRRTRIGCIYGYRRYHGYTTQVNDLVSGQDEQTEKSGSNSSRYSLEEMHLQNLLYLLRYAQYGIVPGRVTTTDLSSASSRSSILSSNVACSKTTILTLLACLALSGLSVPEAMATWNCSWKTLTSPSVVVYSTIKTGGGRLGLPPSLSGVGDEGNRWVSFSVNSFTDPRLYEVGE